jgi:hypothetical protein
VPSASPLPFLPLAAFEVVVVVVVVAQRRRWWWTATAVVVVVVVTRRRWEARWEKRLKAVAEVAARDEL